MRLTQLALVLLLVACVPAPSDKKPAESPIDSTRLALIAEFRKELPPTWVTPADAEIDFAEEQSRVVPGLRYTWMMYATGIHAQATMVVAQVGESVKVLRTPADWFSSVGSWNPETPARAITACAEIAAAVSENQLPRGAGVLYEGPATLRDAAVLDSAMLRRRLVPPQAEESPTAIDTRIWMIEPGLSRQYKCRFPFGSTGSVVRGDSLPVGLIPT